MKIAHFFDIDVLLKANNYIWIVSKTKPSIPIIKLTKSEFNLIKNGIYKKYNCPLNFGGVKYWIPENLFNDLKVKCKNLNVNISDIYFSMQEFMNSDIIDNIKFDILDFNFRHLKNNDGDIYIICSNNTKKNYSKIILKLEEILNKYGLTVKNYYYLSETFFERDTDFISKVKSKILLQHLLGFKTNINSFIDEKVKKYDRVYYYDDDLKSINFVNDSNKLFGFLLENSEESLKDSIKDVIKNFDNVIVSNYVTHNKVRPFEVKEILLSFSRLIKNFDSFIFKNN